MIQTELDPRVLQNIIAGTPLDTELPFLEIADTQVLREILFDMLPPYMGLEGMKSPLIMRAAFLAEHKLEGRVRKKNRWDGIQIPDVNHSYRVAIRLVQAGIMDETTIAAAVLHDVIEDSDTSENELEDTFGPQVAKTVSLLSKNHNNREKSIPSESYYQRIYGEEDAKVRLMAIQIKYADRTDNLACFVFKDLGEPIDQPGDVLRRPGLTTLEALQQNIDETITFLDPLDPENLHLSTQLVIAKSRAQDAIVDYDTRMH